MDTLVQRLGWLPIHLDLSAKPSSPMAVTWMDFGTERLSEPFFFQTVQRLAQNRVTRITTSDVNELLGASEDLRTVRPKGFIFHISRCGSTLISNAVRLAGQSVTVSSEPQTVVSLLSPGAFNRSDDIGLNWSAIRVELLTCLFTLFGTYLSSPNEVVLKFGSINTLEIGMVKKHWPDVPTLIVVRDPVEVAVSNLTGSGGWMRYKSTPIVESMLCEGRNEATMSNEEYAARMLRQLFLAAKQVLDESVRIIDYRDINRDSIRRIAEFFGVTDFPEEGLDGVLGTYAKDPARQQQANDDSAAKRRLASAELTAFVKKWAADPYREILASKKYLR